VRRALRWLFDAAGVLAAFFIFAIFAVMIGGSVMRELGMRTGGSDDLVSWMCAAAAFLGLAHTFRHGDFVRVELLISQASPVKRRVVEVLTLLVATVFVGYLTYWAWRYIYEGWQFNEMSNGLLVVAMWIPQLSFGIGATLLLLAIVDQLVQVLGGERPDYVTAVEERHSKGDFSSEV
jgi:TRAP-type C4-dicarboxylate transport system permease small subunit